MAQLADSVKINGYVHVYGEWGVGSQEAEGTLTLDTLPTDGDTMTVDYKTYTFQDTLTDVDGNIKIVAGDLAATQANLVAAFDLSGVAGTDYATSMIKHWTVSIAAFAANNAVLTAKVGGTVGNSIVTTETFTAVTNVFDAATLGTTTAGTDTSWVERGNDYSGDGTPKAPYATVQAAWNAIAEHIADNLANSFDQNYFLLIVSNSGESNSYGSGIGLPFKRNAALVGDVGQVNLGVNLLGSTTAKLIFQGWNKAHGAAKANDSALTTWTEKFDGEKPTISGGPFGYIYLGASGAAGGYRAPTMKFKDVVLDFAGYAPFGNSLFFNNNNDPLNHGPSTPVQFYGCLFKGGMKYPGEFVDNVAMFAGLVACIWTGAVLDKNPGAIQVFQGYLQNCVFTNLSSGVIVFRSTRMLNQATASIFVASSGKCIDAPATNGYKFQHDMCLFYRKASLMGTAGTSTYNTLQDFKNDQTPSGDGVLGENSIDANPLFTNEAGNDYTLQAGSIAEASGGVGPGFVQSSNITDVDGYGWEAYDFLNTRFIDARQENFNLLNTYNVIRTRRSMGCFQTLITGAPESPLVEYPTTQTAGNPKYIAIEGKASPQGGTLQARHIVSNSSDLTDVSAYVKVVDSVPINITTSNNKINFKENGGGELTATLTAGVYSTAGLLAEIKTQLEAAAGSAGTYTVTYDGYTGTNTQKFTIAVSGAVTTVQFLWHSGTDVANNAREILGFQQIDTSDIASHVSAAPVRENLYDATVTWTYATDYTAGSDPDVSGTWNAMGTGDPSATGTPGTDGALGDGTASIRSTLPQQFGIGGKFIGGELWGGGRIGNL